MMQSAESAAHFVRELARLADRLAGLGLVVAELHCEWSSFGS